MLSKIACKTYEVLLLAAVVGGLMNGNFKEKLGFIVAEFTLMPVLLIIGLVFI